MAFKYTFSPGVEADRRLLPYKTYDEYLDSLLQIVDLRNLRSTQVARIIAALGYRSTGETFTENEFIKHRSVIQEAVRPTVRPFEPCSAGLEPTEPLAMALAQREKANRLDQLHTLIFLRLRNKIGYEISAYIDYNERLMTENWTPYFSGKKKIMPLPTDLSYFHWKSVTVISNKTRNFKPLTNMKKGHLFQSCHDGMIISLDPNTVPGPNTLRQRVYTKAYAQAELYDHVLRKNI